MFQLIDPNSKTADVESYSWDKKESMSADSDNYSQTNSSLTNSNPSHENCVRFSWILVNFCIRLEGTYRVLTINIHKLCRNIDIFIFISINCILMYKLNLQDNHPFQQSYWYKTMSENWVTAKLIAHTLLVFEQYLICIDYIKKY